MTESAFGILVALDLTDYSQIVLEHALDQASRHDHPELHFLTVIDDYRTVDATKHKLSEIVLSALDGLARPGWTVRLHVRIGHASEEIASLAGDIGARLIVIGRFGLHHPHRHLAKTAGDILDLAPCPVLVATLVEGSSETIAQCPDCVAVRASSQGERWFCDRHLGDRDRISTLVPLGTNFTDGGLMW